ncbi:MAG: rod shape-determining protein RodA [Parcubacteria group bacterium]|nr:rod shape-determining protein RodA [Parcubacteria group bacterium]
MKYLLNTARLLDRILIGAVFLISCAGLITMNSFVGDNYFFERQIVWIIGGFVVMFLLSIVDWRFLKRTDIVTFLFVLINILLLFLFVSGHIAKGAQSWFRFGEFSFQPSDVVKLFLILILAKYFSRRHIEIAHIRHILLSGFYTAIPFVLIFLQPDLGSAIIIFLIWLGMIIVSGVSKKHLVLVFLIGGLAAGLLWSFGLAEYQKQRIATFIHPLTDLSGSGYNAYQSTIAVGSGGLLGKGVGYGTQSRLNFLPEYETDFIFAAFAEEWGFIGIFILFSLFGIVIWRILKNAFLGASNFEMLFGLGLAIYFISHFVIHIGMNVGLLPVTGTTLPFMSYGGSHIFAEFIGLGILMGMRRYQRDVHRDEVYKEVVGMR